MPVGHARHQRTEFDTIGAPGGKSQRAPRLKHFALNRAYLLKLKEMIHHPQAIEPGLFCPFYEQPKGITKLIRFVRPGEVGNLQTQAHIVIFRPPVSSQPPGQPHLLANQTARYRRHFAG